MRGVVSVGQHGLVTNSSASVFLLQAPNPVFPSFHHRDYWICDNGRWPLLNNYDFLRDERFKGRAYLCSRFVCRSK